MKEALIMEILDLEWPMFASVNNEGGRSVCQTRPRTFEIMRKSQYLTWTEEILTSYREDLRAAKKAHRNLCTEKYAYMMEFTELERYEEIRHMLPAVSEDKLSLIRTILDIHYNWQIENDAVYPKISAMCRPITSDEDTKRRVSAETYLLCELKTYSDHTIELLHDYTIDCLRRGMNLVRDTLFYTAQLYGYNSLEEAEACVR